MPNTNEMENRARQLIQAADLRYFEEREAISSHTVVALWDPAVSGMPLLGLVCDNSKPDGLILEDYTEEDDLVLFTPIDLFPPEDETSDLDRTTMRLPSLSTASRAKAYLGVVQFVRPHVIRYVSKGLKVDEEEARKVWYFCAHISNRSPLRQPDKTNNKTLLRFIDLTKFATYAFNPFTLQWSENEMVNKAIQGFLNQAAAKPASSGFQEKICQWIEGKIGQPLSVNRLRFAAEVRQIGVQYNRLEVNLVQVNENMEAVYEQNGLRLCLLEDQNSSESWEVKLHRNTESHQFFGTLVLHTGGDLEIQPESLVHFPLGNESVKSGDYRLGYFEEFHILGAEIYVNNADETRPIWFRIAHPPRFDDNEE